MSKNNFHINILGCGSASGVPVIGCDCGVCKNKKPKNKRTRSSIYLSIYNQANKLSLIIDTTPDFRAQALKNSILDVDGVLYTHAHADHINGIDDLRAFCFLHNKKIPIYGEKRTLEVLTNNYSYCFAEKGAVPRLTSNLIEHGQNFMCGMIDILPIEMVHGKYFSTAYRIKDFAYLTDVSEIPKAAKNYLKNLDILIVDCYNYNEYEGTHSFLSRTLDWIKELKPKKAILTHMSHEMDYYHLINILPKNIIPAFDGMKLTSNY